MTAAQAGPAASIWVEEPIASPGRAGTLTHVIRVAVLDDHHAIRVGLQAALRAEPGLLAVGTASEPAELDTLLEAAAPDVLLLDYWLPGTDGLELCRRVKTRPDAPAVLLYSAYADAAMAVPAMVAGADGLIHKGAPSESLYEAIRRVAGGGEAMPPVSPELLQAAGQALDPDDLPILGMLVNGTSRDRIAGTLDLDAERFDRRIERMLGKLKLRVTARGEPRR
jgi:DNA-binding NarL/FixJ family response regulator